MQYKSIKAREYRVEAEPDVIDFLKGSQEGKIN